MKSLHQRIAVIFCSLLMTLTYSAQAANICHSLASPINPMAQSTAVQKPGLGGTGMLAAAPGLGGTGMLAAAPGLGGTGIVGVITGFASICVNGVEVHYSADTPISDNGESSHASALAVGNVVVVNAAGLGDEVQARRITLQHIAIGPLQSVQLDNGQFTLLGQTVRVAPQISLQSLSSGQWVRVSGQRNADGIIQATHVEAVPAQAKAQLLGTLERTTKGDWRLDGTPITLSSDASASQPTVGSEALLQGQWDGQRLQVAQHKAEPTRQDMGKVTRILVEGYVRAIDTHSVTVDHHVLALINTSLDGRAGEKLNRNQRVRISAHIDAHQRMQVDRMEKSTRQDLAAPLSVKVGTEPKDGGQVKAFGIQTKDATTAPARASPTAAESRSSESTAAPGASGRSNNSGRSESSSKPSSGKDSKNSPGTRAGPPGKSEGKH
jgi:hypothetical protein